VKDGTLRDWPREHEDDDDGEGEGAVSYLNETMQLPRGTRAKTNRLHYDYPAGRTQTIEQSETWLLSLKLHKHVLLKIRSVTLVVGLSLSMYQTWRKSFVAICWML
jgi:hypothetical protein